MKDDGNKGKFSRLVAGRKLIVRRKSDGKIGRISRKFYDPKKYEVIYAPRKR